MEPAAFVFPGQGSQRPGMGGDLAARDLRYRRLIADASRLCGVEVTGALRPLEPDSTVATEHSAESTVATQLSVFALSVSLGRILLDRGLRPAVVAGHSLGEYSALVVGGWLDVEAGLEIVARRSAAMDGCCRQDGAMLAVIGLGEARVAEAVRETGAVVANVNGARQIVISGRRDAVARAGERARAAGASVVVELSVAGAFHSPLMAAAEQTLAGDVVRLPLREGSIPFVSSITGRLVEDLGAYRAELASQITAPVRWHDAMAEVLRLIDGGGVVEVGPGEVLRGLLRKVDRRRAAATCGCLEDCEDLAGRRAGGALVAA
jgi:[acyl-carrier-protein] S-malonyltransferase